MGVVDGGTAALACIVPVARSHEESYGVSMRRLPRQAMSRGRVGCLSCPCFTSLPAADVLLLAHRPAVHLCTWGREAGPCTRRSLERVPMFSTHTGYSLVPFGDTTHGARATIMAW
jgi:hypothetical protein